jgi:hypothetical protein
LKLQNSAPPNRSHYGYPPKVSSHVGIRKGYPPSLTCIDVPVAVIFLHNLFPVDNKILPLIILFLINFSLKIPAEGDFHFKKCPEYNLKFPLDLVINSEQYHRT